MGGGTAAPCTPYPSNATSLGGDLRVFVSSMTFNGDLKTAACAVDGATGADSLCQQLADTAGLGGKWMALIDTSASKGADRFTASGPWITGYGFDVFDDKTALKSMSVDYSVNMDENGAEVDDQVWTGSAMGGMAGTCGDWMSANAADKGVAGTTNDPSVWAANGTPGCNAVAHLYCFEQ
jgi:hypothetical protein